VKSEQLGALVGPHGGRYVITREGLKRYVSGKEEETSMPREKLSTKDAAKKADIIGKSSDAPEGEHFHGTTIGAVSSILKGGIKPTDESFGKKLKTVWAAPTDNLAHVYASGHAAEKGDKHYAMVVLKDGKGAGMKNFGGNKSAAYSFNTVPPEHIDRVEIYKVGGGNKPVATIRRNEKGEFGDIPKLEG